MEEAKGGGRIKLAAEEVKELGGNKSGGGGGGWQKWKIGAWRRRRLSMFDLFIFYFN